jgi:predicted transcriptional regulator
LTAEEVLIIRVAASLGADEGELALRYDVPQRYIARITLGRTFKDVGGPIREPRSQGIKAYRRQWLEQIRESVVQ